MLQEDLTGAVFVTGDSGLGQLLEDARRKFLKPDEQLRREALEKALGCVRADQNARSRGEQERAGQTAAR